MAQLIMTPDHPEFRQWLSIPPPDSLTHAAQNDGNGLVALHPDSGILQTISSAFLDELVYDGGFFGDEDA